MSLDARIAEMSMMPLSECVQIVEGVHPVIRWPRHNEPNKENAAMHLVARLFTDAVFNQDVRSISTIIQRVDGGLPKDVEADEYRTEFSECIRELMGYDESERLKVMPYDTVMMALCKSLYDIAVEDIYWKIDEETGVHKPCRPSDTKKQLRDNAMRIILERAGGRKTTVRKVEEKETIELNDWVVAALPGE